MLLGNYQTTLTDGNRVAIPKRFRNELGEVMVVAKWYEQCLVLISGKNWEELLKKLTGNQEILTKAVRDTDRFIMGSAFELESDAQGRVKIPEKLTNFAGITKEVVFLGLGGRVEIWSKDVWEAKEAQIAKDAHDLIEKIAHE